MKSVNRRWTSVRINFSVRSIAALIPILPVLLAGFSGCGTLSGSSGKNLQADVAGIESLELVGRDQPQTILEGRPDSLLCQLETPPLAQPQPEWSAGPEGQASLMDLENLVDEALSQLAQGSLERAQDILFTLRDQVESPLPQAADSLYTLHRGSFSRRVGLLGAILAEKSAFSPGETATDSLLAAGYGRLGNTQFPDSLVPATGVNLPDITADLLKVENQAVQTWLDYLTGRGRQSFQYWLDRKAAADSLVGSILVAEGLPRELIYLAMIESGLSSRAVSVAHAVGPWQFMAGTAKTYGLRCDWWVDERKDMEMSTRAAAKYLKRLHNKFGDWALVLAAYNTGENRVARRIRLQGHDNFWGLRLPVQTTNHIPKFIAAARIGENPQKYGFKNASRNPLSYDLLPVDDATDLDLIARCAGATPEQVQALNPALLRGATPPKAKGYPVRIPTGTRQKAMKALKKVPADQRLTWRRHKVTRGQTLSQIARDFGTSVTDIAKLNHLGNVHIIRPGDQLLIPMPAELSLQARNRAAEKGHYVPPTGYERVRYKVKKGDTLGTIARKLGVSVQHLRKVNAIYKSHLIFPGQDLYAYRPNS